MSNGSIFRNVSGVREGREYEDVANRRKAIVAYVAGQSVKVVYNNGDVAVFSTQIFRRKFSLCEFQ